MMEKFSWEGVTNPVVETAAEPKSQPNIGEGDINKLADIIEERPVIENERGIESQIPGTVEATFSRNSDGTISLKIDNMAEEEVRKNFPELGENLEGRKINLTSLNKEQIASHIINELLKSA